MKNLFLAAIAVLVIVAGLARPVKSPRPRNP